MAKPPLYAIEGGCTPSAALFDLPREIAALSPFDRSPTLVRVSKERTAKYMHAHRRQPILDFWAVCAGQAPPVNNIGYHGTSAEDGELFRLDQAIACFRGVERPFGEDDHGERLLTYILHPAVIYRYVPSMVCPVEKLDVPQDLVFVAHVMPDEPCEPRPDESMGVLTHWEFIEHDGSLERLPVEYGQRYKTRLW